MKNLNYLNSHKNQRGVAVVKILKIVLIFLVIAIIAVAIGLPMYKTSVVRDTVTTAFIDLTTAKNKMDSFMEEFEEGNTKLKPSLKQNDKGFLGIANKTDLCGITLQLGTADDPESSLSCTFGNGNIKFEDDDPLKGKKLTWTRDEDGVWKCVSDVNPDYAVKKCPSDVEKLKL